MSSTPFYVCVCVSVHVYKNICIRMSVCKLNLSLWMCLPKQSNAFDKAGVNKIICLFGLS